MNKFKVGDIVLLSNPTPSSLTEMWLKDNPLGVAKVYSVIKGKRKFPIIILSFNDIVLPVNKEEITLVSRDNE